MGVITKVITPGEDMLCCRQVQSLYSKGLEVIIRATKHPDQYMGEYYSNENKVHIFASHITSSLELYLTLLHEFIHARNFVRRKKDLENSVEKEAKETYKKDPEVVEHIIGLYCLRKRKNWPKTFTPAETTLCLQLQSLRGVARTRS